MAPPRPFVTIRPTARSLLRDSEGTPPSPSFIIEAGPRLGQLDVDVEIGSDPSSLYFNSSRGIPGLVPPIDGLRVEGGGSVTYRVPQPIWEVLVRNPRIFYRASGRTPSGRSIISFPETAAQDLPFLHGLASGQFYRPACRIADLPRLRAVGNVIAREGSEAAYMLRGVNVSGLNHARYFHADLKAGQEEGLASRRAGRWRDAAYITPELMDRLKVMGVNLIRLPLNQDWVLMGYHERELPEFAQTQSENYIRYLEDLDQIIAWASERGMYILLALHTLRLFTPRTKIPESDYFMADASVERRMKCEAWKQPYNGHLPDHRSWLFWSVLARRYRECSAVMFDLCNEPHEVRSWYDDSAEYRGVLPSFSAMRTAMGDGRYLSWWRAEWKMWAERLEEVVHRVNQHVLVFISGFGGPCWSSSLEDMEIHPLDGNPNVVYAVHWYWNPALGPETWRRHLGMLMKKGKHGGVSALAQRHPVFVKEWGVETPEATLQESALRQASGAYIAHWRGRTMPAYDALIDWAEKLSEFFVVCMDQRDGGVHSGFAGFAAWSTGDKPRIFEREGVSAGPYSRGFPLTDFGRIVEKVLGGSATAQAPGGQAPNRG